MPKPDDDETARPDESLVREWVRGAREGDAEAFERVYRAHVGRIFALCLRMSGNEAEAEELTQDVFVRAWEKLGTFRMESRFSTWLHRLAVNLVLQARRTKGRRRSRFEETPDLGRYDRAAVSAMPGTRIDLERAIRGLPDGARRVLVLRDIEGFKYREIADMVGVSLGTVKAQIHRARGLVQEALER